MNNPLSRLLPVQRELLQRLLRNVPGSVYRTRNAFIQSSQLGRQVKVEILEPRHLPSAGSLPLLILNDGQDNEQVKIYETLKGLLRHGEIPPVLVVGVVAGDRMQEYGISGVPDYLGRGSKAMRYQSFVIKELMPWLHQRYAVRLPAAIAGYSLGGLSAFDIAWHCPEIFNRVGVFSGSFWWRLKDADAEGYDEHTDRIAHRLVRNTVGCPALSAWLQTGTHDETADRNGNGIIDSIDDTIDLISELKRKGVPASQILYTEIPGGEHNHNTWKTVMPDFLRWCFGTKTPQSSAPHQ